MPALSRQSFPTQSTLQHKVSKTGRARKPPTPELAARGGSERGATGPDPIALAARRPGEARAELAEIARVRERARDRAGAPWFPPLAFGSATILAALVLAVAGPAAIGPYWLIAGLVALLAVRRHYRGRSRARGVTGRRRTWYLAGSIWALGFAAGVIGGELGGLTAGLLAPIGVGVVGYAILSWWDGRPELIAGVGASALLAGAVAAGGGAAWLIELAFGLAMCALGAWLR